MNDVHKSEMAEANAKARGLLRLIVGITVGIISAKRHDWLSLINMGGGFILIEAVITFVVHFLKIHKLNQTVWANQQRPEYSFANKIMWKQVFVSLTFIGVVAALTKIIANIFI